MSAQGGSSGGSSTLSSGYSSGTGGSGKQKQNTQGLSENDKAVMQAKGISLEGEKGQNVDISKKKSSEGGTYAPVDTGPNPVTVTPDIAPLFSFVQAMGGDVGGAVQQLTAQSAQRGLAEGGDVAPGETVMVGEAGKPETVTAKPSGGATVQPTTQAAPTPASTPSSSPSATAVKQPASTSSLSQEQLNSVGAAPRTTGQVIHDVLVGMGLGPAGGAAYAARRHGAISDRQKALATLGIQNPQLLATSPLMAAALDSYIGPNASREILRQAAPDTHNAVVAQQLGLNVPQGAGGGVSGADLIPALRSGGYGFSLDKNGAVIPSFKAPTQTEIGAAAGFKMWTGGAEQLVNSGIPLGQAYKIAAQQTIQTMAQQGMVPPPELRRVALADTDVNIEAAKAGASAAARLGQEQKYAAGIAQERAQGETMGKANAEAAIPFQSIHVPGPVGPNGEPGPDILIPYANASAYAATGNTKAVSLGKSPSKTQLDTASMEGADLIQGPGGELIKLPIGHEGNMGAVSAASVEQGPEARAKMDQISKALDDIVTPKFLKAFPSEKEMGRMTARGAGEWHSWTARFTDSPEVLLARGNLRKLAIPMTTLLGTGKRLSNQELANAMGPWQAIVDGTATREQVVLAQQDSKKWLSLIDERMRKGETPGTNPAPTTAQPQAKTAAPAPDNDLAARLAKAVDAGGMTKEQAAQAYRAMTGVSDNSVTPAP